ncbi:MAG: carboxyvinyl-carboxyphosphonate phosphorylmutase [Candidatus Marinimicrobia bacterium]|nr:carboxyvinyl-carboxyphosphonate phosphorylmutase [Candidatus Neomarinimicrobiota bacterium]|tara:strand:+ start:20966 stop:21820 length:855 start_codon:yes stop_codon:yes gene_type:complete
MNKLNQQLSFKDEIINNNIVPMIGVYDVFSAALAVQYFNTIFCSGYGFSASYYGLPDEGYIAWSDMVSYIERIRSVLPSNKHIVVDIDDGYGDPKLAADVVKRLERVGASAVIIEDQRRPKKCGHLPGKEILDLDEYLIRLNSVLKARNKMFVIGRTDTPKFEDAIYRVKEFKKAGVDGILVEGIDDISKIPLIRQAVGDQIAITINLIEGGKTDPISWSELEKLGVNLINYSTPCLFSAHGAINNKLKKLIKDNGSLLYDKDDIDLNNNNQFLKNLHDRNIIN